MIFATASPTAAGIVLAGLASAAAIVRVKYVDDSEVVGEVADGGSYGGEAFLYLTEADENGAYNVGPVEVGLDRVLKITVEL